MNRKNHPFQEGYYSNLFNGTSQYLTVPDNAAFTFGAGDFTFEAWLYRTAAGGNRTNCVAFSQSVSGFTSNSAFYLGAGSDGFSFIVSTGGTSATWSIGETGPTIVLNTWYHVVWQRRSNVLEIYVNGVLQTVASGSSSFSGTIYDSTLAVNIGSQAGGAFFPGYISNARIVKGVAVYTGTFTVPIAPLTATQTSDTNIAAITGTATSLLTCQSNRFLDNSTNLFAITAVSLPSVTVVQPFTLPSTWVTVGSGLFNGTSGNYLTAPTNAAFNFGTGDFTIECWSYLSTANSGYINLVFFGNLGIRYGDSGFGYLLQVGTNMTTIAGNWSCNLTQTSAANIWRHVAFTREGGVCKLFVNGILQNINNTANPATFPVTSFSDSTNISGSACQIAPTWPGLVSNVRVVKGVAVYTGNFTVSTQPLTATQTSGTNIAAITGTQTSLLTLQNNTAFNNNICLDSSINNFAITRAGNTTQGTFSPYGANWSNYFDGTGDYMDPVSSSVSLSANWTIELWFNTAAGDNVQIFDSRPDATNGFYPTLGTVSATQINTYYNSISYSITVGTYRSVWNHVAMVKNSGTLTIYFNGVSVYSVADSNTWLIGTNRPRLAANGGYFSAAPSYYTGYISNFRIVNGTAVYTTAFTPSTTPLTAITNTRLLTCQSNRFVDNSSNAYAITRTGDTRVQRFSPFSPSAAYTASTTGGSAYFDGAGDYLTVATNDAFRVDQGDFTIEGWVYFPGAPTAFALATRGVYVSVYSFYAGNTGAALTSLYWEAGTGAWAATPYTSSAGALIGGQWNHIAYVRSSTSFYMYANGVRVFSQVITTIGTNVTAPLWIGSYYNQSSTLTGNMADFRFVKGTALYTGATYTIPTAPLTAITNTSLLLNYTNTGIVDYSTINNPETVGDTSKVSAQTPYAGSYYSNYFDGTGDYLTINYASGSTIAGDFTWETWAYDTAATTYGTLLGWRSGSASWSGFIVQRNNGANNLSITINGSLTINQASGTYLPNNWNHIALVRLGTTVTLYVNGTNAGTVTVSGSFNPGTSYWIGSDPFNNIAATQLSGYISNQRFVNGTAVYTGTFAVPTAPLTAISGTSLLTCQSNRFVDNSSNAFAITIVGNTRVQSFNPFQRNSGSSMYFDGTGDYLTVPANAANGTGTGAFTIECWVYFNNFTNEPAIVDYRQTGTSSVTTPLLYVLSSGVPVYYLNGAIITGSALTAAAWYHVALSRSGSSTKMFINGSQTGSTYTDTNNYVTTGRFIIGGSGYTLGANILNGYMNDLRITKGYAHYTTTFTPPTQSFI